MFGKVKSFITSKLRGVFHFPRAASFPRGDGAWSQIDAQNLKSFLASSTGARLNRKLANMEASSAIEGAKDTFHTVHSAGVTNGISSTIEYLYSLTYTFDRAKVAEQRQESADQRAEREMLERIGAL
jgi:hypothetical protein